MQAFIDIWLPPLIIVGLYYLIVKAFANKAQKQKTEQEIIDDQNIALIHILIDLKGRLKDINKTLSKIPVSSPRISELMNKERIEEHIKLVQCLIEEVASNKEKMNDKVWMGIVLYAHDIVYAEEVPLAPWSQFIGNKGLDTMGENKYTATTDPAKENGKIIIWERHENEAFKPIDIQEVPTYTRHAMSLSQRPFPEDKGYDEYQRRGLIISGEKLMPWRGAPYYI